MAFIPLYCTDSLIDSDASYLQSALRTPAPFAVSQNDLDLGLNTAIPTTQPQNTAIQVIDLFASAAINITGILAPVPETARAIFLRVLPNSSTITLVDASASSAAANRMEATSGANVALAAGQWTLLLYDIVTNVWVIAEKVETAGFKIELPASVTEGVTIALGGAFYSAHNTGNYDAAGTKTANAVDAYYAYGVVSPTVNYASSTALERKSQPLESGRDEIIQTRRGNPFMSWVSSNTTGGPTIRFRINEQGQGMNKH